MAEENAKAQFSFQEGDDVVYPTHGVGKIQAIEKQSVGGIEMELIIVHLEKEKLKLSIPQAKVASVGLRPLSDQPTIDKAMVTLKKRPRHSKLQWNRQSQVYEEKIHSGDLVSIAEVARDLYYPNDQLERSYARKELFDTALSRLVEEIAVINEDDPVNVATTLSDILEKSSAERNALD